MFCSFDSDGGNSSALLSALYATVAGLLGVNMFPVRFPGNSLLRWQTRSVDERWTGGGQLGQTGGGGRRWMIALRVWKLELCDC